MSAAPDADRPDGNLSVRRKRVWRAALRPVAGRRLPAELQPAAVAAAAVAMPGGVQDAALEALLERIDQSPFFRDTRLTPYFDGASAFEAMLAAIAGARVEILVEAYILSGDATGRAFLDALTDAVRRGVSVRILADAFGSSRTRRDFWSLIRHSGSQLLLFRRPRYAPVSLLPILDHRKLLVVDRHVAFTGGMNIADEYRSGAAGDRVWRDTHVRMTGSIVRHLAAIHAESWEAAGGDPLPAAAPGQPADGDVPSLILDTRPGRGQEEAHATLAALIGAARRRLWITNAYFAPRRELLWSLIAAAGRGVDVRLLLPGRSDIPLIRLAGQGYYRELLQGGVRVFEYQPAVLHAKTLVVDGHASLIGSSNFDFRSFAFNHECNVLAMDPALGERMEQAFLTDLGQSREIALQAWRRRPLWHRLLSRLARLIAPLL